MIKKLRPLRAAVAACLLVPSLSVAQNNGGIKVIDHDKGIKKASSAAIDNERFEIGVFTGLFTMEDFNTNPVLGFSMRYYVFPSLFVEANSGTSKTKKSTLEGNDDFIFERDVEYTGITTGYKVIRGRSFWGKKRKFNTGLFVLAGVENVDFDEKTETGFVIGASYKTVLTDSLAVSLDFKNHSFNRRLQGDEKQTNNPEISFSIGTFF